MTSPERVKGGRRDRRAIVFRVVAGIAAVPELMFAAIDLPSPWLSRVVDYGVFSTPDYTYPLHLWHGAQWGTWMGILICGSLLLLLRRPREKPLLMQFIVLAIALQALLYFLLVGFHPAPVVFLVGALIVAAVYPEPRSLLSVAGGARTSRPLLGLGLAVAALLALDVSRNLRWQFAGVGGEHHELGHWTIAVGVAAVLTLGALLTASRRPGWQSLGVLVGAAFVYLGLAAVTVPDSAGSWGLAGVIAVLGGVAFIVLTRREAVDTAGAGESVLTAPAARPAG